MRQPQVDRLEREIDALNADPRTAQLLRSAGRLRGGGSVHVARAVVRRAERLHGRRLPPRPSEKVGAPALKYINRLSDFLFVAARHLNRSGEGDILWVPGAGSGV